MALFHLNNFIHLPFDKSTCIFDVESSARHETLLMHVINGPESEIYTLAYPRSLSTSISRVLQTKFTSTSLNHLHLYLLQCYYTVYCLNIYIYNLISNWFTLENSSRQSRFFDFLSLPSLSEVSRDIDIFHNKSYVVDNDLLTIIDHKIICICKYSYVIL